MSAPTPADWSLPRAPIRLAAPVLVALPSLLVLLTASHEVWAAVSVVVAAVGAWWVGRDVDRRGSIPWTTWPAVGVMATVAVVRAPIGSHDLWSYAFYGRMISRYHANPYRAVPISFRHDVLYHLVTWRHAPTAYGPVFTAYSAVLARIGGASVLALRLGFQLPAALAVIGVLVVLVRRGRLGTAVVIALQPMVWVSVVNGGHNDAWVAAAIFVGVLFHQARRPAAAGAAVGFGALVKLSGMVAVIPMVAFLALRRRWRDAAWTAGTAGAMFVGGAVVAPRSLSNAAAGTRELTSIASIWRPVRVVGHFAGPIITTVAMALVLFLVAAWTWRRRRDRDVAFVTGAVASAFPLASSYSLPWYSLWGLPALALSGDLVATALMGARGSLILAANSLGETRVDLGVGAVLTIIAPIAFLVAFHLRVHLAPRSEPVAPRQCRSDSSVGTSTIR